MPARGWRLLRARPRFKGSSPKGRRHVGSTARVDVPLRLKEFGETGPIAMPAPYLFVAANFILVVMLLATLRLLCGRLLPPLAPSQSA